MYRYTSVQFATFITLVADIQKELKTRRKTIKYLHNKEIIFIFAPENNKQQFRAAPFGIFGQKVMKTMDNIEAELKKAIVNGLEECRRKNTNPDDDMLWVMCGKCDDYTNEACVIMNITGGYTKCNDMDECAEKYTEICLNAGATANDIFLAY